MYMIHSMTLLIQCFSYINAKNMVQCLPEGTFIVIDVSGNAGIRSGGMAGESQVFKGGDFERRWRLCGSEVVELSRSSSSNRASNTLSSSASTPNLPGSSA
jgi:hypothetical protein